MKDLDRRCIRAFIDKGETTMKLCPNDINVKRSLDMNIATPFDFIQNTANMLVFLSMLPFILAWRLLRSILISGERSKPWRRVVADTTFRWVIITQKISFIGSLVGPGSRAYTSWCKINSVEPCIEDIDGGAQLFWIGNKRPEKVILYLHGGGFSLPMGYYSVKFWRYVQCQLQDSGCGVSIAILDYTLVPEAHFPVPLEQTVAVVHHLLSIEVRPENIQVTGDSAGGNLVLQLLLHMLHPLDGIRSLPRGMHFRGAYLMSPWLYLVPLDGSKSYFENAGEDVVASKKKFAEFGARVLNGIEGKGGLPYIDASHAPPGWYKNIDGVVDRVLITAGGHECLRDDIVEFADAFCKAHGQAELVVDALGVHDDPFNDFMLGEEVSAELTPKIVQWFTDGFQ